MKPRDTFFLVLLIFFFLSTNAFPWGSVGHETVAYIAEQNISPATLEKLKPLLAGETLEEISTWADQYKQNHHATSGWHYIDLPIRESITVKDLPRFYSVKGHEDNNVISQIEKEINELKDSQTSFKDKQQDLKFLVHFIGDLHMPLHCSNDNDKGGNDKQVMFFSPDSKEARGHRTNLHSLWDNLIEIKAKEDPVQLGNQLDKAIRSTDKQKWDSGTIEDWAFETYLVTKKVIYPGFSPGPSTVVIALSKDYYSRRRPYVDEQLEKAGIRLAYILQDIFGR